MINFGQMSVFLSAVAEAQQEKWDMLLNAASEATSLLYERLRDIFVNPKTEG